MLKVQAASHSLFFTRTEMATASKPPPHLRYGKKTQLIFHERRGWKEREKDERSLIKVALLGGVCIWDDDYFQLFREQK